MTQKRMIFHMGFQKTGTTSIQGLLNENAKLLPLQIAASGLATRPIRNAGQLALSRPSAINEQKFVETVASYYASLKASDFDIGLVSDENIVGRVLYDKTGNILDWTCRILALIEAASDNISTQFVFYTRDPQDWLYSSYRQSVKRAGTRAKFEIWADRLPFELDWSLCQKKLQSACRQPVIFLSMEDDIANGGVLGNGLLDIAGISDSTKENLSVLPPQNTAMSESGIRLMRILNHLPLSKRQLVRISEFVEARESPKQT